MTAPKKADPGAMRRKTLLYEKRGRIAYITLNRPRRLNAISIVVWCAKKGA